MQLPVLFSNLISSPRNALPTLAALSIGLATLAGCNTAESSRSTGRAGTSSDGSNTTANPRVMERVEREHVIGPNAARELDYRVDWQYVGDKRPTKMFRVIGDSTFILDDRNFLTRVRNQDGQRLWRMQVSGPIEQVVGINFTGERVFVTTGGAVLVLDAGTGSQVAKQDIQQIANTQPTIHGDYLVYGSRNGQIVWHSGTIGYKWRGYQIANAVNVPPVIVDSTVAAVGSDGELFILTASDARQVWSKKLLAPVVSKPAIGHGAVFVAGQDQYISAFDLNDGRSLWKVLRESPMTDSPILVGDRLYQRIPRHGLACYAAMPIDKPGGELIWNAPLVDGNVFLERRSNLYVWSSNSRKLMLVEPSRGAVVKTIELPTAKEIQVGGEKQNEIFAISDDGRVVHLVPRN